MVVRRILPGYASIIDTVLITSLANIIYKIRPGGVFMCKKICLLLALACVILLVPINNTRAESVPVDTSLVRAAVLMEAETGRLLFASNEESKLEVAGLSRLAALLVICDAFDGGMIDGDTMINVSHKAASVRGATAFLSEGESMKASDLLRAAVMINAGDAIHALAATVCGSDSAASERINNRLSELGISSRYSDIIGDGIALSAYDLALIGRALIKSESFRKYSMCFYENLTHTTGAKDTELANPNKLVKQYSGCMGVATGSSQTAGYCGVFAAERGGTCYIAVSLGAANSSSRFVCGIELMDYGFANFRSVKVVSEGDIIGEACVSGSLEKSVQIAAESDMVLLVRINDSKYYSEAQYEQEIAAPISEGQTLGKLVFTDSAGELMGEVNLVSIKEIPNAGFSDCFDYILRAWLS